MRLEQFFEKFELFADAPGAVAKMRELVLELAIQGKLVPQDCSDEPASSQLERIAAKKLKTGRVIRAKAGRAGITAADESATHLPSGWAKASLAELISVLNGRAYAKDELLSSGTPVLRVGNLFTSNHWYYSDLTLEADKYCDKGDLIFAWSASFGPFIWPGPKAIYHYHIWKLELHSEADLSKHYLYWFLQNKTQEIKRAGHGVSMLHMTKEKMEKLEVMVPPLAEQTRIVAKLDELMALCDRLEAQQQERDTRHAALARASLARFANAPTPANLDFFFHKTYAIPPADLRKTVLTLAVQGKLVPQDPDDEPAAELIKRRASKESSSGDQRGATGNSAWPIDHEKTPYELPASWEWCRLGALNPSFQNGASSRGDRDGIPVVVLRLADVVGRHISLENTRELAIAPNQIAKYSLQDGDILITRVNGSADIVGRFVRVESDLDAIYCDHFIRMRVDGDLADARFIELLGATVLVRDQIASLFITTAGQKTVNQGHIGSLLIAVPPLAEQRRIVAKVDQLMALVDQLETQLTTSRATAEKLMDAVVAELTSQQGAVAA